MHTYTLPRICYFNSQQPILHIVEIRGLETKFQDLTPRILRNNTYKKRKVTIYRLNYFLALLTFNTIRLSVDMFNIRINTYTVKLSICIFRGRYMPFFFFSTIRYNCSLASIIYRWPEALKAYVTPYILLIKLACAAIFYSCIYQRHLTWLSNDATHSFTFTMREIVCTFVCSLLNNYPSKRKKFHTNKNILCC